MHKKLLFISLISVISHGSLAQRECGTESPISEWNAWFNSKVQAFKNSRLNSINYTLPIVVHILHDSIANDLGGDENISQMQVQSQLTILNEDYSGTNADIINIPSAFQPVKANNTGIQFCLAKIGPNGNTLSEPGIDRINWQTKGWSDPNLFTDKEVLKAYFNTTIKPNTIWDPTKYLNIWVAKFDNVSLLGSATFPGGTGLIGITGAGIETPTTSGVIINMRAFGNIGTAGTIPSQNYNKGRTATHEIGHYLGLIHIFQGGCVGTSDLSCASEGDFCCDTPPTALFSGNNGCPSNINTCQESPVDNIDMTMNYMDYVYDNCMFMFTADQALRMQTAMAYGTFRIPLATSNACCVTQPDLILLSQSIAPVSVTAGEIITASFIVRNNGLVSAEPNYVNFYISQDIELTPGANGDVYLGQYFVNQTLAPQSQTSLLTKQLTIPTSTSSGPFYILFAADATEIITECSETNNVSNDVINVTAPMPDLVMVDYVIFQPVLTAGGQTNIRLRIANNGTANAPASIAKFYFSANQIFDGNPIDIDLNNNVSVGALAPGQAGNITFSQITVPSNAEDGTAYIALVIDAENSVSESNEVNNYVFYPIEIYSPAAIISDSLALVDLFNSTNGSNWINKNNWLTTAPINTWYGISINTSSRRVTNITLNNNNLTGNLPASIGTLTRLTYLDLSSNHLSGNIPSSIGNLSILTTLRLTSNQLTGNIPASIGNLTTLTTLFLDYNQLTGSVPSSIGNLTNLSWITVRVNQLTGSIPPEVGNLTNLVHLQLDLNQLSGEIPASIGNLVNLSILGLHNNQLTGNIPASLGNLTRLTQFRLDYNQLSGNIPSSLGNISNSTGLGLWVNNNQLTGEIPASIGNIPNLLILALHNNHLSGPLPSLAGLTNPTAIYIHNNKFTFEGLEPLVQQFGSILTYAPQDTILPLHNTDCKLSLTAGGTLANNTYHWHRNNQSSANITGDSAYIPPANGNYFATVTNSVATQLTLYSDTLVNFLVKPELGPPRSKVFCPNTFGDISHLFDDTLNVHPEYSIVAWTSLSGVPINPTLASFGNTYLLIVQNATGCRDTGIVNTILYPIKNIVAAVPQTLIANRDSTDPAGWTHYYSGNILLLSIKKNGNNIGSINDGTFQVKIGATAGAGSGAGIHVTNPIFNNPSGSYIMNRYWSVTPTNQPNSPVNVRFYFTNQDFLDVKGSVPSLPTEQSLQFYKLDGGNADPTTNFAGANYIENLTHATIPSLFNWTYTFLGCLEHQAEFLVDHFSGGGGGATVNGNPFATPVPPTITGISPASATIDAIITISGSRLGGTTAVTFGGTPASSFTVVSPTTITAKVGAGSSGNVGVTNPNGTSVFPGFTFILPPKITSFSPESGPVGTTIVITGVNFSSTPANNIVYIGGKKVTVSSATTSSLTVVVPPGASYQPITVTTNNLTASSSKPFTITFTGGGNIQSNSFDNKIDFSAAFNPTCVSIKDFSQDGVQDIAVANLNSGTVNTYTNLSAGGNINFVQTADATTNTNMRGIASGDFDGDGKPDIAVANVQGTVSVLRNTAINGNILFTAISDYNVGANPRSLFIDDFDGDGKPDIATANAGSSSISVLRNNSSSGTISFTPAINYTSGSTPYQVSAADIDGDGKTDLVCVNNASNTVSVYRNTSSPGAVSFAAKVDFPTGSAPRGVAITDINGDGAPDIAVSNFGASTLSVLNNTSSNGTISFAGKIDFATGTNPWGISSADIDGDGKIDLSTGNFNASTISVLRNTSTGGATSLAGKIDLATGSGPIMISTADLNIDGKPELITSNINANTLSIFRNKIGDITDLCPGGSAVLTTNFSGTIYQWQVNTGSGFINISDNSNYSGTGTQTLQLTNIPSGFYGYQYSCLVNGIRSNITTLKFSNYWTGSVNSAWENPLNWSCGTLPDANSDVIINNGSVVVSTNTSCRSVNVKPGASINVSAGVTFLINH